MDGPPQAHRPARRPGQHLRGPCRQLEEGHRQLPRAGGRARGLRGQGRLHACRVHAADRAPVLGLVGISGDRLLRRGLPTRQSGRLQVPGGQVPPCRHRRHHGLGARSLPEGRFRARTLRRHPAVRGSRPAARRAPRLGHVRVQLRQARGAQLPGRQRLLLARRIPHRRAARGRGVLDAVPGLQPQARPVAPEHLRRSRKPRSHRLPQGSQRHRVQEQPRRHDDRRGIHRLPRHHRTDRRRRTGIRPQVEHGLDARHAAVPARDPHQPQMAPQRDHLLDGVRLFGALRAADQPRRGRVRQGLAVRQDAGRRLAALRRRARPVRLPVGAPGQEPHLHGQRDRAVRRVES